MTSCWMMRKDEKYLNANERAFYSRIHYVSDSVVSPFEDFHLTLSLVASCRFELCEI